MPPDLLPKLQAALASPDLGWWLLMVLHSLAYPAAATLALFALLVFLGWQTGLSTGHAILLGCAAPLLVAATAAVVAFNLPSAPLPRGPSAALRIAHLNAYFYEEDAIAPKIAFARAAQADVVSFVEVNPALHAAAASLRDIYPYQTPLINRGSHRYMPMLLLSRWPIEPMADWAPRLKLYRIKHPTHPFYVLQAHPQSPYLPGPMGTRNEELAFLAHQQPPQPLVMLGDFNTTPWDPQLAALRSIYVLAGSYIPTFPSYAPMTPIDLLFTRGLPSPDLSRVRVAGTDHLGLVADFGTF